MKTIVAGSRNITDYRLIEEAIDESGFNIDHVVCGQARGVDMLGAEWGTKNNKGIMYFPADWKNNGRAAGFIRNAEMANVADALVAIWDGKSHGTKHMIDTATKKGLHVYVKIVP